MPEKGWEIVTVKTETKKALMKASRERNMSINALIVSFLTRQATKPDKGPKQ